jgi:adenylate kinase family enzyme
MKIHIFGASGAGSTTQGRDLSTVLHIPYFDTDNYFWEVSDPPFTIKRSLEKRNEMLWADLAKQESWIIGGSLVNWGEAWNTAFDLAVFMYIPPAVRLERLRKRELERYGDIIYTDPERNRQYNEFMDWAADYDTNTTRRSLVTHKQWIGKLTCPVLIIEEDLSVEEKRKLIVQKIHAIKGNV